MAHSASNLSLHALNSLPSITLTSPLIIVDDADLSGLPPATKIISINSSYGELFSIDNYGIIQFSVSKTSDLYADNLFPNTGDAIYLDGNLTISGTITASNIVTTTGNQTIAGLKTFTNNIAGNGTANTLPNQTLSNTDNTRILTQKTSARDDMWSCWQKRMLMYGSAAGSGTGFGTTGSQRFIGVSCGTSAVGRASTCYETGMTVNPGQGAAWNIPSSFAVGFGFYGLYVNIVATSNNITSGSNTFTSSNVGQLALGHRIYSTAFPEETYVQAINGYIVTATKNAIDTPGNGHPIVFAPDQISRFVLGSSPARIHEACPNANELFQTQAANSIGDTSIKLYASTALTMAGTVILWNNQPYFISTVANSNISNANANFYVAGSYLPSTTINVLRIDNVVGTPATTTGTWNGTVTPTNQIVVASATNIVANQTVSGLGIPHNTTVLSVAGTTITLNQNITSAGSGVAVYFGYQRVYIDQNAVSTQTGQNAGFFAKSYLNQYIYGRGLPSATTMTNISNYTSSIFTVTVSQAFTKACVSGLFYAVNFTTNNLFTGNNCIFMEYSSDPADGYLKVRLGYMLNGIITYSAWTSFPMGNVPNANYNFLYQAVIDYNAATGQLRLFVDRNGAILTSGNPRDWPKPPTAATITLSGVEALNNKTTGLQFGVQIFGNNVNTLGNTTTAALYVRDAVYYPYQTFID